MRVNTSATAGGGGEEGAVDVGGKPRGERGRCFGGMNSAVKQI